MTATTFIELIRTADLPEYYRRGRHALKSGQVSDANLPAFGQSDRIAPIMETNARTKEIAALLGSSFLSAGEAATNASRVMTSASRALEEFARWNRFDTVIGPLIGGAVIFGTLIVAALAAAS